MDSSRAAGDPRAPMPAESSGGLGAQSASQPESMPGHQAVPNPVESAPNEPLDPQALSVDSSKGSGVSPTPVADTQADPDPPAAAPACDGHVAAADDEHPASDGEKSAPEARAQHGVLPAANTSQPAAEAPAAQRATAAADKQPLERSTVADEKQPSERTAVPLDKLQAERVAAQQQPAEQPAAAADDGRRKPAEQPAKPLAVEDLPMDPFTRPATDPAAAERAAQRRNTPFICQVDGCGRNLSKEKEYYRRYRVCKSHAGAGEVMLNSQPRRYCQQCSLFHPLEDFDGDKRSCRERLMWHNNKRRKRLASEAEASATTAAVAVEAAPAAPRVTRHSLAAASWQRESPEESAPDSVATAASPVRQPARAAAPRTTRRPSSGKGGARSAIATAEDEPDDSGPVLRWPVHGRRMRNVVQQEAAALPPLAAWQTQQADAWVGLPPAAAAAYGAIGGPLPLASAHYGHMPSLADAGRTWSGGAGRTDLELQLQAAAARLQQNHGLPAAQGLQFAAGAYSMPSSWSLLQQDREHASDSAIVQEQGQSMPPTLPLHRSDKGIADAQQQMSARVHEAEARAAAEATIAVAAAKQQQQQQQQQEQQGRQHQHEQLQRQQQQAVAQLPQSQQDRMHDPRAAMSLINVVRAAFEKQHRGQQAVSDPATCAPPAAANDELDRNSAFQPYRPTAMRVQTPLVAALAAHQHTNPLSSSSLEDSSGSGAFAAQQSWESHQTLQRGSVPATKALVTGREDHKF